ncbi:MAG TPA: hypothetical protein VJ476_04285 [Rhizomicrobium sp.]|nr:hypothetical protein [Rhizomicrobium sp.]
MPRKSAKATAKTLSRRRAPVRWHRTSKSWLDGVPVRSIAVMVGVAGLAALVVSLLGPRRLRDDFVRPISAATLMPLAAAVGPQADQVWAQTRPWRDRVGRILSSINTDEVRDLIAERLSNWVDRIR